MYSIQNRIILDASSLASRVTIYPKWGTGHFSITPTGNLTALNIKFANVIRTVLSGGMTGGSISQTGGALRLVGCLFYNNSVVGSGTTVYGGAVYSKSGAIRLDSCA